MKELLWLGFSITGYFYAIELTCAGKLAKKLCTEDLIDALQRLKKSCSMSNTVLGAVVRVGPPKKHKT